MISGRQIVAALKGRWAHGRGTCRCPAHTDREPSLSVRDLPDRVLVHCFGLCSQQRVIEALRSLGLWPERDEYGFRPKRRPSIIVADRGYEAFDADELANMREARAIWGRAKSLERPSVGWLYLWSRHVMPIKSPPALRWLPELYNAETRKPMPAMVAAVQDRGGRVTAIQRTWLRSRLEIVDGVDPEKGTRAALKVPKKTLGPIGDGAVRLGRPLETIGIAEGVETALAAKIAYSLPVWASLGAWRMGSLWLPDIVRRVVIFADAGDAGVKAAQKARDTYEAQNLDVIIEYPPEPHGDFAEWLAARSNARTIKSAA